MCVPHICPAPEHRKRYRLEVPHTCRAENQVTGRPTSVVESGMVAGLHEHARKRTSHELPGRGLLWEEERKAPPLLASSFR